MRSWNELPEKMQNDEVRYYYDILCKKERALKAKRFFDFSLAMVLSILLLPIMVIIAIMIKTDSKGPVFTDRYGLLPGAESLKSISSVRWFRMR